MKVLKDRVLTLRKRNIYKGWRVFPFHNKPESGNWRRRGRRTTIFRTLILRRDYWETKMAEEKQLRHVVNLASTDLSGDKKLIDALRKIKGVSFMYAHAVLKVSDFDEEMKTGYLTKEEALKIEEIIKNPLKYGIPSWMINRQKDYETGEDMHLIGANQAYVVDNDIKRLKKIRSLRGMRHAAGLPVRGQNVKSNFRRSKSANAKRKKK